ncbi:MAG: hypothetical protein HY587_00415 [Candidatus Omnitrophica bacterium]|nr:hypothetical protein [Candidatus Omnitrophota bacterium]
MKYKEKESKAMLEVRRWKREVAKEASKLHGQARLDFYNKGIVPGKRNRKAA